MAGSVGRVGLGVETLCDFGQVSAPTILSSWMGELWGTLLLVLIIKYQAYKAH